MGLPGIKCSHHTQWKLVIKPVVLDTRISKFWLLINRWMIVAIICVRRQQETGLNQVPAYRVFLKGDRALHEALVAPFCWESPWPVWRTGGWGSQSLGRAGLEPGLGQPLWARGFADVHSIIFLLWEQGEMTFFFYLNLSQSARIFCCCLLLW